eukprot:191653-Prymnesium_polylepis.1
MLVCAGVTVSPGPRVTPSREKEVECGAAGSGPERYVSVHGPPRRRARRLARSPALALYLPLPK